MRFDSQTGVFHIFMIIECALEVLNNFFLLLNTFLKLL